VPAFFSSSRTSGDQVIAAPQAAAQEAANLGRAVARGGDVDHLHPHAIDGVEVRAILILKFRLKGADGPILDIDRALHRAIVGPGCLEAQPALEHASLIGGHLLKKLRHGILVSVVLSQLGEGENGFEREMALGGGFLLGGGHMKILATNAALIAADPEHPQQCEHHSGLAGAVGADEGG
jgi:hypothetical protein